MPILLLFSVGLSKLAEFISNNGRAIMKILIYQRKLVAENLTKHLLTMKKDEKTVSS